jgi:diguanylate cyclase (GGDEF)-like protein
VLVQPAPDRARRPRVSGRRYDPVEAKAVVTTLFVAAGAVGAAVQLLPLWPGADRVPIALVSAGPLIGALVLRRLRSLPYPVAAALTGSGCVGIGYGQYCAGPGAPAATFGAVFALALAAAFLLYSTPVLVLEVALAAAAQATALVRLGEGRTAPVTVVVTLGSAIGAGIVARKLANLRAIAEAELAWHASHDALTGLANRVALTRAWHDLPEPVRGTVSVLMLDLRGFKQVNDELGHQRGDEVLVQVATRLAGLAPPALPARLGGDEFAVLLPGVVADEALAAGHRVCDLLHDRYRLADGLEVPLGATVGVATRVGARADGGPAGEEQRNRALSALLAAADGAMYHARETGRAVATAVERAGASTGGSVGAGTRAVPAPRPPRAAGLRSVERATRGRRPEEQVPPDG